MLSHVPSKGGGDVVYSCILLYVISLRMLIVVPHGNIVCLFCMPYIEIRSELCNRLCQSCARATVWLGYHSLHLLLLIIHRLRENTTMEK